MPEPGIELRIRAAARRLMKRCDELAQVSDEPGGTTRSFLSPATRQAQDLVAAWMKEAGLAVRLDAIGNLIGRLRTGRDGSRVVLLGSHLDTVPNAGRYDGILGVLAGIEVAQELHAAGETMLFHLDVIGFSEEEGVRFGAPFLGSLAVVGQLPSELLKLEDAARISLRSAISSYGLDPERIPAVAYPPGSIAAYLEAHIEQGPSLELQGAPLGVVTGIAGQTRLHCRIRGQTRHAGTTPMTARRDALAAAAEIVLATENMARSEPGLVATVGSLSVEPNASNCVPGGTVFSLDLRHADDAIRHRALAAWKVQAGEITAGREVQFEVLSQQDQDAIPCDPVLTGQLADAVQSVTGEAVPRLASGAGHDAMILARVAPVAMLFLRCAEGISHHPDESVQEEDVVLALHALTRVTRDLCCGATVSPAVSGEVKSR